jgi:hypothetical protein
MLAGVIWPSCLSMVVGSAVMVRPARVYHIGVRVT